MVTASAADESGSGAAGVSAGAGPSTSESPRLRRDLAASVGDGTAFGVMVGIGETYVPAFVLALGLGEVFAGLVTTIPLLVGSLLQSISPWAVRRLRSHRTWVVACAAVQGLCFLPLIVAAISGELSKPLALVIASLYWGAGLATGPAWNTWQGTIIPRSIRASFFAQRSRLQQIATMTGFLAGGYSLQWGRTHDSEVSVFIGLFSVAFVCRGISTLSLALQSEPEPLPAGIRWLTFREQLSRFSTGSTGSVLLFAVAMQTGVFVAGPYFNPYILKVLEFSYSDYASLLGVSFVAKFVCLPWWGRVAQRLGPPRVLWIGSLGLIPLSICWNFTTDFWLLLTLQIFAGAAWAGYELALVLLFLEALPENERTSILTLYNIANAIATVLGSTLGAILLQWGQLTPTAYHLVFAASTVVRIGAVAILWWRPIAAPVGPIAEPHLQPFQLQPGGGSFDEPIVTDMPADVPPTSANPAPAKVLGGHADGHDPAVSNHPAISDGADGGARAEDKSRTLFER